MFKNKLFKFSTIFLFSLILSLFTYKLCYFITEKYYFDKFFYKKSHTFGYNLPFTDQRYQGVVDLNTNHPHVLGATNDKSFKLAIFGDSYVYGMGIKDQNRFAKILEQKLNKIRPTTVLIFSETSTSPINFLEWYDKFIQVQTPDLSIFALVNNDAYIRPNPDMSLSNFQNITAQCQSSFPEITPIPDISLKVYYQHLNLDDPSVNKIASDSYEKSWSNPINLCVLNNSLQALPTDKAIYFITDDYLGNNDKFAIYKQYLIKNSKNFISSEIGKNIPKYAPYWQNNVFQNFQVSQMEQHPSALANQMYADILFKEITTDPKWLFVK